METAFMDWVVGTRLDAGWLRHQGIANHPLLADPGLPTGLPHLDHDPLVVIFAFR